MGIMLQEHDKSGPAHEPRSHERVTLFVNGLFRRTELTKEQLAELVYGDMGGWLLERRTRCVRRHRRELNQA